jgi:hypothetical protein
MKMSAMLTMNSGKDEPQSANVSKGEPLEMVRPYIRKIGGKEYHCIDSEWIRY